MAPLVVAVQLHISSTLPACLRYTVCKISLGSGSGQDPRPAVQDSDLDHCKQKNVNVNTNRECRWLLYEKVLQDYWSKTKPNYEYATVKLFSGTISTACGVGQTEMEPFYCSGDSTVYIDDSYVGQLLKQLGAAGGDAAELYIVAHEFGYHIQPAFILKSWWSWRATPSWGRKKSRATFPT